MCPFHERVAFAVRCGRNVVDVLFKLVRGLNVVELLLNPRFVEFVGMNVRLLGVVTGLPILCMFDAAGGCWLPPSPVNFMKDCV